MNKLSVQGTAGDGILFGSFQYQMVTHVELKCHDYS